MFVIYKLSPKDFQRCENNFSIFMKFQFFREHLGCALARKRTGIPLNEFVLHQDNAPGHAAAQLESDLLGFQRLAHAPRQLWGLRFNI